ncbi:hypothetical protein AXF42_Ash020191 [Apostasia shenzhenica]|uniref:Uncharacterized protein n=1 Tax=Apostasia shenzhenica TaxID=1088818 RepID=A0A2H9ZW16_9ASPA|nr:hypothetical protein AXF42_Ash020191 [Apostasia shenzhenica]
MYSREHHSDICIFFLRRHCERASDLFEANDDRSLKLQISLSAIVTRHQHASKLSAAAHMAAPKLAKQLSCLCRKIMAGESWMAVRAKEELKLLEARHPERFDYLKLELQLLISDSERSTPSIGDRINISFDAGTQGKTAADRSSSIMSVRQFPAVLLLTIAFARFDRSLVESEEKRSGVARRGSRV